jgi:VPDSG-CTERM motif
MKKLTLVFAILLGLAASSRAGVTIDVTQVGSNVVFTTSGSLDLTGASAVSTGPGYGLGFIGAAPNWYIGTGSGTGWKSYALSSYAPSFGTSGTYYSSPTSSIGDDFFIWGFGGSDPRQVGVDTGYVSGAAISSVMTFNGATIAGLFLTAGVYNYTIPNDTIVLRIGSGVSVPDTGVTVGLLGFALIGLAAARRRIR